MPGTFGDGATGTGATATHTYADAGTYTVKLTVTDDQGATGAISQSVTVTAPPTQPPSASFTQTCTYLACTFDGSASAAEDGATITAYAWDFGDGTTGTGVTPSHTYAAPGPYSVTLTVTDSNTKSAFLTNTVTVTALYAADTFTRTVASGGWGTADTGGAWSVSPASTFSVNGGLGRINLAAPASGPAGFLNSVSKANLNVVFDASVDKVATGGGAMVNLIVRHVGTTDYRYKVRFMADGTVHLVISKVVSSTETTLREVVVPGLTFTRAPVARTPADQRQRPDDDPDRTGMDRRHHRADDEPDHRHGRRTGPAGRGQYRDPGIPLEFGDQRSDRAERRQPDRHLGLIVCTGGPSRARWAVETVETAHRRDDGPHLIMYVDSAK